LKLVCTVNVVNGNLKPENSEDYAQKPQRNCMFINASSGWRKDLINLISSSQVSKLKIPRPLYIQQFNSQIPIPVRGRRLQCPLKHATNTTGIVWKLTLMVVTTRVLFCRLSTIS
jgi:hypothetical protein